MQPCVPTTKLPTITLSHPSIIVVALRERLDCKRTLSHCPIPVLLLQPWGKGWNARGHYHTVPSQYYCCSPEGKAGMQELRLVPPDHLSWGRQIGHQPYSCHVTAYNLQVLIWFEVSVFYFFPLSPSPLLLPPPDPCNFIFIRILLFCLMFPDSESKFLKKLIK